MESAVDEARRLIAEGREHVSAWRLEEASAAFERAAEMFPTVPATLHALAMVRYDLGDGEQAEALLRRAMDLPAPNSKVATTIHVALGQLLLARGGYSEGYRLLQAWRELPGLVETGVPATLPPRWNGEPLEGRRIVVWPVEGIGDQIMYARMVPMLLEAGAGSVAYIAHDQLARLFRKCAPFPVEHITGKLKPAHLHVTSSGLAAHFLKDFTPPPQASYLRRPWATRTKACIGIKTRGNPAHWNDAHRSLPDDQAARLLAIPKAMSLDPEATGAKDFYDTAKIIAGLDVVVSVDTSVAHLAASMGKPVWLLSPAMGADWRWGRGRDDTVWYPTVRQFRQTRPFTWPEVIDRVLDEMNQLG